ncbi:hypothetical protein [Candidatus Puniceispirillum sp.]|uniref:hypothetical protein n=1 Tax=Candidatus Puniceispirillum sp. TaxID=2026719 RepID=UPI003F695249
MRQVLNRVITQTHDYVTDRWRHICFMAGLAGSFIGFAAALSAGNAHAATVFLVCDGNFKTITGISDSRSRTEGTRASLGSSYYDGTNTMGQEAFTIATALDKKIPFEDEFKGAFYLSIDGSNGVFSRVKLQPFERDVRLPSLDLEPEESMENGIIRSVNIVTSEDELLLSARSESGGLVEALVEGRPMTPTREIVKDMSLSLNRFNGRLEIEWKDHEVRDYKPVGAIRSTKKRYSDVKQFDAMCKTMQERLF